MRGMTTHDLTGDWRGHYEQAGGRHGIRMVVAQKGQSLVGRMQDDDTVLMGTVRVPLATRKDGSPLTTGEAELVTTLPESSRIEGDVDGARVAFTKSYQGSQRTVMWMGGNSMEIEIPSHSVAYRGELDADGSTLRGEWRLRSRDGVPGERGAFELRRERAASGGG
jgi:hypothetical protein